MKTLSTTLAALTMMATASAAQAEITWSKTAFTYLNGTEYLNPYSDQKAEGQVATFSNAASYNWGKSFFFVDRFLSDDEDEIGNSTYLELSTDISLTGGKGFVEGPVKDVFLATTWEHAATVDQDNILAGISARWKLPGYAWIDTGIYYRWNGENEFGVQNDENYHFASAWGIPFSIGPANFSFEGFIDLGTETENNFGNDVPLTIVLQPKLKLDVGGLMDKPGMFFAGIEYDYRKNKFGVEGANQYAPQFFVEVSM